MFNDVSYALSFLAAPPQTWVVKTGTGQAIPAATWTTLTLSSIVLDSGAVAGDPAAWLSATPSRIYARTPGWYDIEGNVEWASNTDSTRRLFGIAHLGVDSVSRLKTRIDVQARGNMKQRVSTTWFLNADEYLELWVWTNTAQSLAADPGTNSLRTGLRMRWFSM